MTCDKLGETSNLHLPRIVRQAPVQIFTATVRHVLGRLSHFKPSNANCGEGVMWVPAIVESK